ncbi:MAG: radical SAM protein [Thermoproteota archaeon]
MNNIPLKKCTYSCVYCQLGKTRNTTTERRIFHETEEIFQAVKRKVDEAMLRNEKIDYLSFVPDGEPTLELELGEQISVLRVLNIPIAILTNASLVWKEPVRKDLSALSKEGECRLANHRETLTKR